MDTYTHRITLQGPTGQRDIELTIGSLIIGRQMGCDLVLEDTLISRRHARLDCSAMDCTITDLNSSNGTRVNGERLVPDLPRLLAPGEVVQVGAFSLTYQQIPLSEPAPEPPPPVVQDKPKVEPKIESKPEPVPEPPVEEKPPVKPPKKTAPAREEPPAQPPPPPKKARTQAPPPAPGPVPPGMEMRSTRLIQYLPDIYHTDFMARFLGIFESTSTPIEWTIDNFDLFLSPASAPPGFLPWLANWFNIPLDASWTEDKAPPAAYRSPRDLRPAGYPLVIVPHSRNLHGGHPRNRRYLQKPGAAFVSGSPTDQTRSGESNFGRKVD